MIFIEKFIDCVIERRADMYVLMVTPSKFPDGDAGAVRDYSFAKIYMELGYKVIHIGMSTESLRGVHHDIEFVSLYKDKNNIFKQIKAYISYSERLKNLVKEYIRNNENPAIIHINDIDAKSINYLIALSETNNIPILHDSTEWYSPCEFTKGKFDKAYFLKDRLNRKVIRKPISVITISKYLEKHFIGRGLNAIRIPVVLDVVASTPKISRKSDKIQIIYAGSPASKDYLKEIILGIEELSEEEKEKISLNIVGINKEQLSKLCNKLNFHNCIHIYGRVPRTQVLELLNNMDFSILLRPENERYAQAGFPTKAVEAMSNGVAMLCNITSDLGDYLIDQENSIIISNCSEKSVISAIRCVIELDNNTIIKLRTNARKTAEMYFDYRLYIDVIRQLLG